MDLEVIDQKGLCLEAIYRALTPNTYRTHTIHDRKSAWYQVIRMSTESMEETLDVGRRLSIEKERDDFSFSHEDQLYRYKKGKIKLLCKANPELMCAIVRGEAYHAFSICS